jgi:hypothetical protein
MLVRTAFFPVVAAILLSCSPSQTASTPVPVSPISALPARTSLEAPLTASERAWIESTLQSLSLREKVGQMTWIWVLGDYTSTGDSTFAEVMRWVEKDGVGGATMSLGTPGEVAAKLNFMQRRARVPLLASADLEPAQSGLEGGVFTHYLMDAGSATVMPSAMAIAATGREQDAYDAARVIGLEARAVGIHINFAPTVDVNAARRTTLRAVRQGNALGRSGSDRQALPRTRRHGRRFARWPSDRCGGRGQAGLGGAGTVPLSDCRERRPCDDRPHRIAGHRG